MESQVYAVGMAGGYHTAGDVDLRIDQLSDVFKGMGEGPEQFIKELHQCAAAHKRKGFMVETRIAEAAMKPPPMVASNLGKFLPGWDVYTFRSVLILQHVATQETVVLMQKDLDRIEKFVSGAMSARIYAAMYGALTGEKREKLVRATRRWQDLAVAAMSVPGREYEVCRAFDIIYFIHLASVARDAGDHAYILQMDKFDKGGFGGIVSRQRVLGVVGDLAFKEQLEVLQQYKLFPAADFDSYAQAQRQEKLYEEYTNMHDNAMEGPHFEGILLYHRWLMMVAFYERHKFCPGSVRESGFDLNWAGLYPYLDPRRIPFRDSVHVNFDGAFVFNTRRNDCYDLIKDKAICPERIKAVENIVDLNKIPARNRTQLLDVLSRDAMPDVSVLAANLPNLFLDVKADDKPEAKKPHGRWFFEAHSDIRLVISEYEDSNADYAKFFPGSVVGLGSVDVRKRINAASAPCLKAGGEMPLYISFDIEKFSPAFNIQVSRALDEMWAEAYGVPHISQASLILTEGDIHYVKGNFHHTVKKTGSDFEGFFGRRNTMYHCAVMGYAVNTLRRDKVIEKGAHFATLIDDGLLRLLVREDFCHADIENLRNQLEEIYRAGSMQISWDKTFISSRVCVFLNEVRYMGRSVTPGMKAILRVHSMSDEICPSLLSDLELVASTARGALTAGATPSAAYAIYTVHVCKAIRRWGKTIGRVKGRSVLKLFLPARLGGLSLCGLMALAGSVTHDDLVEALGVLRIAGFRYAAFQDTIRDVADIEVIEMGEEARFKNPHGVRATCRILRRDRGTARIKRYLISHANLPAINHYLLAVKDSDVIRDSRLPAVPMRFPVEMRERVWASTPEHVIEGIVAKFLKARSALCFVPFRILYRATIANKTEAKAVLKDIFC